MKRFLFFAVAAVLFATCSKDALNEQQGIQNIVDEAPATLTVGFEDDETRIQLNEAQKTVWTKGDLVSVFYRSDANQQWQYTGETGARTADLTRVDAGEATTKTTRVVVVYPYNEDYYLNTEFYEVQAFMPATQTYLKDSYGLDGNIMISQSTYNQIALKNVCGWLKLQLTGNGEQIKSITVRGNNGEQVAGEIYIDSATADAALASDMGDVTEDEGENMAGGAGGNLVFEDTVLKEVTLNCLDGTSPTEKGVALGAEATAFYIALPPQTFTKGLTVEITDTNGLVMTKFTDNEVVIERNHIKPMTAFGYNGVFKPANNEIYYTNGSTTAPTAPNDPAAFGSATIQSNTYDAEKECWVITFDKDVTEIGIWAFYNRTSLTSVTIGNSVTTIGDYAFCGCTSLTSVTIGNSVTTIGCNPFLDCDNLKEFKGKFAADGGRCLIKDNTIIAYANASGTTYTIPDSVTTIGEEAFLYCTSLTSVTIPDSVKTIVMYAFGGCEGLASVTIGNSVTTIEFQAFAVCSSLTSVTIPDSVTTIEEQAFIGCESLTSVTIGNSVTTIGGSAFAGCNSLKEFKGKYAADGGRCLIIDGVLNAFAIGCGVTQYTIPDNVTKIGDDAFLGCTSLTSVTIPDSVTTIGERAFGWCSSLKTVYCKPTTPPTGGYHMFYLNASGRKILVPASDDDSIINAYKAKYRWSDYDDYIFEEGPANNEIWYTATAKVEPYKTDEFGATYVSNEWDSETGKGVITFEGNVTKIGDIAFSACDSLTSVTIPDSVTTIGSHAFHNCDSLTSVTIGDSVTTIGEGAFSYCSSLKEFKGKYAADGGRCLIIDGVLNAFAIGCGVTQYTIPDSVTTIGYWAFRDCSSLTNVTIPDSVTTIGELAFNWCDSLTSVTIGNNVTTIGDYAFADCGGLASVTIGNNVTTIGEGAFSHCSSLKAVYCKPTTPPTGGIWMFDNNASDRKIYVLASDDDSIINAYKAKEYWSNYADYIEEDASL